LSTGDRATAQARAALLDAAYARIRIVHAATHPKPETLAGVLIALRDRLVLEGEYGRAARAADRSTAPSFSTAVPLPAALAGEVMDFVASVDGDLNGAQPDSVVAKAMADGIMKALQGADAPDRVARYPATAARAAGRAGLKARAADRTLLENDLGEGTRALEALMEEHGGLRLPPGGMQVAARAALRALAAAYREDVRRELGAYPARLEDDPTLNVPLEPPAPVPAALPPALPEAQPPAVPDLTQAQTIGKERTRPRSDPLLSAMIGEAVARLKKGNGHAKTARDMSVAGRLFTNIVGDRPIDQIQWQDAAAFRDTVVNVPSMHGKGIFEKLSASVATELADLIDLGDRASVEAIVGTARLEEAMSKAPVARMSKKTVNKHMSSLKGAVVPWFDKNRQDRQPKGWSPFNGEFFSKAEVKADARLIRTALSDTELHELFSSPLYTGHADDRLRAKPGEITQRDAYFWGPLISLHSCARMEEILQLRPRDIELYDGIWVFAFARSVDLNAKTPGARRRVPIHPVLISLGLVDYAREMERRREACLFPELEPGPDGRFSYHYTKWFTEHRRAIGVYEPGRDFHALRHTAITRLFNRGVDSALVAAIAGHAQQGVSAGVYLSGFRLAEQAKAVAKLDFRLPFLQ
jgi:integrase